MSTIIRPEVSEKNEYWIDKHRYYELKHFCLQYPLWKKCYNDLDGLEGYLSDFVCSHSNIHSSPTEKCVIDRDFYYRRIKMLEKISYETDAVIGNYILKAVTEDLSYNYLKAGLNIPCCRDTYYRLYRKFFWLLSKERK